MRGRLLGRRDPGRRTRRPAARSASAPTCARGRRTTWASRPSTGSGSERSRTHTTGSGRSASRRSPASTASASAAATSSRWPATSPSSSTTRTSATSGRSTARCRRRDQWLPILVGDRRAREIVLLCEEIPARRAEEWGLVNRAVPAAELDGEVDRLVERPRSQASADHALREAAPELLARAGLVADDQPRPRLARRLDGDRGAAGRGALEKE